MITIIILNQILLSIKIGISVSDVYPEFPQLLLLLNSIRERMQIFSNIATFRLVFIKEFYNKFKFLTSEWNVAKNI